MPLVDLDTEDVLRQAVIDAAFGFCSQTRAVAEYLAASKDSWGIEAPPHFTRIHDAVNGLADFLDRVQRQAAPAPAAEHVEPSDAEVLAWLDEYADEDWLQANAWSIATKGVVRFARSEIKRIRAAMRSESEEPTRDHRA